MTDLIETIATIGAVVISYGAMYWLGIREGRRRELKRLIGNERPREP